MLGEKEELLNCGRISDSEFCLSDSGGAVPSKHYRDHLSQSTEKSNDEKYRFRAVG
jgi:hypothetical protein